jgi:hypothetical protein
VSEYQLLFSEWGNSGAEFISLNTMEDTGPRRGYVGAGGSIPPDELSACALPYVIYLD